MKTYLRVKNKPAGYIADHLTLSVVKASRVIDQLISPYLETAYIDYVEVEKVEEETERVVDTLFMYAVFTLATERDIDFYHSQGVEI